jgi:fumarate hydratase class I
LPDDVIAALKRGYDQEKPQKPAFNVLSDILSNCELAEESSRPLCQDTGTNIWYVYHPPDISEFYLTQEIFAATKRATELSYLRPNAVCPLTGENSGNNIGKGAPFIHFYCWPRKEVVADLMLKGGGSENVSRQYSLPYPELDAGRDMEGIRRVVLDAVFQAQGAGCSPGIVGVGIGGDRVTSMFDAKEQLFRLLIDKNTNPILAEFEDRLLKECNELGVGPMGYGGKTTVLGVKATYRYRLPAGFFVSISYICWACRRASVSIKSNRVAFSQISQIAKRFLNDENGVLK